VIRYHVGAGQEAANAAMMSQLLRDAVTSLVWFPLRGASEPSHPMNAAAAIGYHPEWVTIGWNNYLVASTLNAPSSETSGSYGVAVWNKMPQLELEFWNRAFLAGGGDPAVVSSGALLDGLAFYNELKLLAAGIQMAGPRLTPETFAAGLRATTFPNPGAGAAPSYQGRVGFRSNDATMVEDFTQVWLDTRMTGPEVSSSKNLNTYRAYCYVALGRRYEAATWLSTDGFYETDVCR
jgi:hypothetical protein